ncbi:MAG: TIGR01440 family protein [Clostridia bacterium]|nr:TIGR01440 family protein [Clostridia bacterium]
MDRFTEIKAAAKKTAEEIIEKGSLTRGNILVVGCSTSEVMGSKIGTDSNYETATAIYEGISEVCGEKGIFIAAQCCEHLNRAIIIEKEAIGNAPFCNVVPQPKAGGSFATNAYKHFSCPVAVEHIKADAGIDIGFTLIGMHLKEVAVPVRLQNNKIGEATVLAARTRAKFIGGCRAVYDDDLL